MFLLAIGSTEPALHGEMEMAISYWAWARHNGKVELLRVTRVDGKSSQEWTGQTFKSDAAAAREVARLNGCNA